MTSSDKGVAILGAGIFSKEAHLPGLASLASAPPLKAVYSRSEKSAKEVAAAAVSTLGLQSGPDVYHDGDPSANLDVLLAREDISSVIVVLPITTQPAVILKCWQAGKHVLSEKPVAKDVASGIDLISTYLRDYLPKGIIWRVAENFEAEPAFRAAAQAIRDGKIGERIIFFQANVFNYIDQTSKWYNTSWRTVPDYQGGFLLDGGVHSIAALRLILPQRLTSLSGFASLNKDYLAPHDTITAVANASSHFHGTITLAFGHSITTKPNHEGFLFEGDKGFLSVNFVPPPQDSKGGAVLRVSIKTAGGEQAEDYPMQGVEKELESFFAKVRGEETIDIGDPLGALRDVAVIQAALNSNGQLVDLEQLVHL